MNEPRRLIRSGGPSQRLLDSASLDRPSDTARRNFAAMASTASAFARNNSNSSSISQLRRRRANPARTLATWIAVGAAASVTLGLIGSTLLNPGTSSRNAAAPLATLSAAPAPEMPARSPDIAAEPARPAAPLDEVLKIEAARAAFSRGEADAAIAQLNDYDAQHPQGQLKPESIALRIQVLSKIGKPAEARALADEFQRKYPTHPLLQQVRGGIRQ